MSNDFRNRDEVDRRRSRTIAGGSGGTDSTLKELILLPNFDTFIFSPATTGSCGADRWTSINTTFTTPNTSTLLPIGLLNPWNDGATGGPTNTTQAVRTPTRIVMGFDLTALPANANILAADLQMTVAGSSYWTAPLLFAPVDPAPGERNQNFTGVGGSSNIMDNVWVAYNFDGGVSAAPGKRAFAFPVMYAPQFSWYKFIQTMEQSNESQWDPALPVYGVNNWGDPWSIRRWYVWGQRNFELHMPFGRPRYEAPGPEKLSYQADAYLCCRDGLTWSDGTSNYWVNLPAPEYTNDFVATWKALITGRRGSLSQGQWENFVGYTGANNQFVPGWFNPADPIKVIAYNGTISKSGNDMENQYPRWNALFASNYDAALQRLKDSVQPFIDAGMKIGLDALVIAPGPIPGDFIPLEEMNFEAQRGWWEFFTWLKDMVGISNLYCEAYPIYLKNLRKSADASARAGHPVTVVDPNPYLGMNIMSGEDWSYSPSIGNGELKPHKMHELGVSTEYLRTPHWGNSPKVRRNATAASGRSQARYPDLVQWGITAADGDLRIPLSNPANNYQTGLYHIFAARNLKDRYDQEGDPLPEYNFTRPGIILPHGLLQQYNLANVPQGQMRFIDRFRHASDFKAYLDSYVSPQSIPEPPTPVTDTSATNTSATNTFRAFGGGSGGSGGNSGDCDSLFNRWAGGAVGPMVIPGIQSTTNSILSRLNQKLKQWSQDGKIDIWWFLRNLDIIEKLMKNPLRELGHDTRYWLPLFDLDGSKSIYHLLNRNPSMVEYEGTNCQYELYWRTRFVTERAKYLGSRQMMERIKKGLANVLNKAGEPLWDEENDKDYKKYNDELFFDECIGAGLTCRQIYNTDSDNYIKRLQATFDAFFDAMDAAVADQWFWEIPIDWDVLDPKEREKIKCKGRLDYPAFKERYLRQQLGKKHKIPPGDPNGVEVDPLSDFDEILQGLDIWHDLNFTLDRQLQLMYEAYTKCSVCQDPSIYEETPKARNPQNNAVQ